MIVDIKDNILVFHRQISDDPNHRYRSWDHCYSHFQKRSSFTRDEDIDSASLHLAFYLASWGMYRGSSFLLWKDYRVHEPIVRELLEEKYEPLWNIDFDSLRPQSPEVDTFFTLAAKLKQVYKETVTKVNGVLSQNIPSDILVTKILLGTLGCTPAYDRLVVEGIKFIHQFPTRFDCNSYLGFVDFYQKHAERFKAAQSAIEEQGMTYPVMKLVDMYFWNLGYQLRPPKTKKLNEARRGGTTGSASR